MRRLLAGLLLCACGGASSSDPMGQAGSNGQVGAGGAAAVAGASGAGERAGANGTGGQPGQGGQSGQSTGGSSGSGTTGAHGKIRLIPNIVAGSQTPAVKADDIVVRQSAIRIGSPSATNLRSLKYFITSIQLCQNVVQAGSGYSSAEGCISLYQGPIGPDAPDYTTYLVTQAQSDNTAGHFIDLMTAEGQAALRQPVTLDVPIADLPATDAGAGAADAGVADDGGAHPASISDDDAGVGVADASADVSASDASLAVDASLATDGPSAPDAGVFVPPPSQAGVYRYGLINFMRPIKVTAEFPLVGQSDQYFRTRAVTHITSAAMADGYTTERVQIGDTLSGPTEETTYMLNNGGALFTFQKPFVITRADIDAQTDIKIDLVFNPENFGQAYELQDCANQSWSQICDPLNNVNIDMPYVRMNPVPRKSGEKTRKETYLMDYDVGSKLRIELYYNDADPEAGVQGVDTAVIYMASATNPANNVIASNFVSQTGSVTTSDASLTLMDYQHAPNLTGLVRRRDGTATVHCLFTGAICPTPGGSTTRAYAYVGDTIVSGD